MKGEVEKGGGGGGGVGERQEEGWADLALNKCETPPVVRTTVELPLF